MVRISIGISLKRVLNLQAGKVENYALEIRVISDNVWFSVKLLLFPVDWLIGFFRCDGFQFSFLGNKTIDFLKNLHS